MTLDRDDLIAFMLVVAAMIAVGIFLWKPWEDNTKCATSTYLNAEVKVCVDE